MDVMCNNYMPGDSRLVERLVSELKSQGIFDQFRKECIADVDTKPAYQNLRQRVEGTVATFLKQQTWSTDLNKNQLREQLRKKLFESGFLETGVERIVDQVVNPKISTVFLPKVEDVVYTFLGMEKPAARMVKKEEKKVSITDLLPTDLEAVSPESVDSYKNEKKKESHNDSFNSSGKIEEDDSPPFEPIVVPPNNDNSVDDNKMEVDENSHLSGHSGLQIMENEVKIQNDISSQDSQNSNETQLSILMSEDTIKVETSEDSNNILKNKVGTKPDEVDMMSVTENSCKDVKKDELSEENSSEKIDNKDKKLDKSKDRRDDRHRKSSSTKDKDKSSSKYSSHKDSSKKDSKSSKSSSSSRDKNRSKDRNDKDKSKYRDKYEKEKEKSKTDKDSKEKTSTDKGAGNKEEKDKDKSKSDRDKSSKEKDKYKSDKDKYQKDKDKSKYKDKNEKDKYDKDRSYKIKEKTEKDKNTKDNSAKDRDHSSKEKHKEIDKESSKDRSRTFSSSSSKHNSSKDKRRESTSNSSSKEKSSSHKESDKSKKDDGKHSLSKKDSRDSKKKSKDDHFSSKIKKSDRRSTDRDSNDGTSSKNNNFSTCSESGSSKSENNSQDHSSSSFSGGSGDSGNSDETDLSQKDSKTSSEKESLETNNLFITSQIQPVKYIKPKFALNFQEARKIMKIRKQLAKLEKQSQLSLSNIPVPNTEIIEHKEDLNQEGLEEEENLNIKIDKIDSKEEVSEETQKNAEISIENFQALEAKLAQVMSEVNHNSYETEEEISGHDSTTEAKVEEEKESTDVPDVPNDPNTIEKKEDESCNIESSDITEDCCKSVDLVDAQPSTDDVEIKENEQEFDYPETNEPVPNDTNTETEDLLVVNKNEHTIDYECLYLDTPTTYELNNLEFLHSFIPKLQKEVKNCIETTKNNFCSPNIGKKRKLEENVDFKNNNDIKYLETVKKRMGSNKANSVSPKSYKKRNCNNTEISPVEHFSLPLSPAESDKSNDRKEEDLLIPMKQKRIIRGYSQRYSSEDLYKPRPVIGRRNKFPRNAD